MWIAFVIGACAAAMCSILIWSAVAKAAPADIGDVIILHIGATRDGDPAPDLPVRIQWFTEEITDTQFIAVWDGVTDSAGNMTTTARRWTNDPIRAIVTSPGACYANPLHHHAIGTQENVWYLALEMVTCRPLPPPCCIVKPEIRLFVPMVPATRPWSNPAN